MHFDHTVGRLPLHILKYIKVVDKQLRPPARIEANFTASVVVFTVVVARVVVVVGAVVVVLFLNTHISHVQNVPHPDRSPGLQGVII